MYYLSDHQIDYILSDIRARGVEMEDLQQSLLDHICCIIEQNLGENGDFEGFYQKTIPTFYKDALWEIEEETISLLMFKHYYTMKKLMIGSGAFSAFAMSIGILFKFMHWPGAAVLLVLGIVSASLLFLPLFFTLKAKEKQSVKDKAVIAIGALSASLLSLSILFKVMHWPYANMMGGLALLMLAAVFLPVYFFGGVRNPDTRVNTIASSVIIILGCGLVLTLYRTPYSSRLISLRDTRNYLNSEQIVKTEQYLLQQSLKKDSLHMASLQLSNKIVALCEELKAYIVESETGRKDIAPDFESTNQLLSEKTGNYPFNSQASQEKLDALLALVDEYNRTLQDNTSLNRIPTKGSFIESIRKNDYVTLSVLSLLNQLSQVQMYVLQNERTVLASK